MPGRNFGCRMVVERGRIVVEVSSAVFIYYFNCISFAIRLSGRKVAIKLID